MKTISTTNVRKNISSVMDMITKENEVVVIKNHERPEVIMIKYPRYYNSKYSDVVNFNINSSSFDFLEDEPDIYTLDDLKNVYEW